MRITPTELRADLYRLLDHVVDSGEPLLVRRGDVTLRISRVEQRDPAPPPPLRPDLIVGDPDDLVHVDLSAEWSRGEGL